MQRLISIVTIIIISPLLLFISIIILLSQGRPIFFKQIRPGYKGTPFSFYKFRTMSNEKNYSGLLLSDNERMTKIGSFLRKTSLDELPSIFNILKGDMNFVGPRPLLTEYLKLYNEEQKKRHDVKPGITGWAQINGRNSITWEQKFDYDIWYVENQSFLLDLKILFLTIFKVLKLDDINQSENITMEKFKGTKLVNKKND